MLARNLSKIFSPRSIAVLGASERAGSVGNSVWRNVSATSGLRVYPVNPKHASLAGQECWPRVGDLPEPPDLAVICTPAATVPQLVRECGERGVGGLVVLSAGFREVGGDGAALEKALAAEQARFPALRMVGPNCLGFMAPHAGLNASFVDALPPAGNVAFLSQSGALCSAVLDWSVQERVGFSYFVSLGNMLDVGVAEMLDYLRDDPHTASVVLYAESISDARRFMSAARAFTRHKPIIAYKAGRFAESAKAAASHTGALAGVDSVYEAALARAGVVRVFELDDLFDCAELLARRPRLLGRRLAVVTNAGGPGVMATDALMALRGTLADLSDDSLARLNACLPPFWSHGNPVDILGDATFERFRAAVEIVLEDPHVDGLLVVLSPQAMTDPTRTAQAVLEVAAQSPKPVLVSWMGGARVADGNDLFRRAGVPTYSSPEKAVRAFMHLVTHAERQTLLYETPREVSLALPRDRTEIRRRVAQQFGPNEGILTEAVSKEILAAYEIPVTPTAIARTSHEAAEQSRHVGFPVVLKLLSPDITHKSDVGGVELNIGNEQAAVEAFERIVARARAARPESRIDGVTVQPMVVEPHGIELIVGAKRDPIFGMVMLVGSGGVYTNILQDRALELPPLNERLARRMLESLRAWPLLQGYRGKPAVHLDELVEVLIRLSYLIADHADIAELDINPLLVTPQRAIALDARIVVDRAGLPRHSRPYSHLSIRPYPDEFVRDARLRDGSPVLLRPIQPEDEPLWQDLHRRCSADTIHRRFRYMFKATTHEMATRMCYLDYDRELAIVAEHTGAEGRQLAGIGRLVANVDHTEAEFAVLVADAWQGRGLGLLLTDDCLEICRAWGIRTMVAETDADNHRMINLFRKRGFETQPYLPDTIRFWKKLD